MDKRAGQFIASMNDLAAVLGETKRRTHEHVATRAQLVAERDRAKRRLADLDADAAGAAARMSKAEAKRARRAERNLAIAAAGGAELSE